MLGSRLRQFRLALGLSMDELVAAMGGVVTKQSLSKYERGLSMPTAAVLRGLSKALGVSETRVRHLGDPGRDDAPLTAADVVLLRRGAPRQAAELERRLGELVDQRKAPGVCPSLHALSLARELGELSGAITESLAGDHEVDPQEARRCWSNR